MAFIVYLFLLPTKLDRGLGFWGKNWINFQKNQHTLKEIFYIKKR